MQNYKQFLQQTAKKGKTLAKIKFTKFKYKNSWTQFFREIYMEKYHSNLLFLTVKHE